MVDLPTDTGISNLIRTFIPGIIFVGLYSIAIVPILMKDILHDSSISDIILLWITAGTVFGTILASIEKYIYKFYEGYWPIEFKYLKNSRLSKIMKDYENYPLKKYGIDSRTFWPHLRIILPKDVQDEIKILSAYADLPIYISFILIPYSIIAGLGISYQLCSLTRDFLLKYNYIISSIYVYIILFVIIFLASLFLSFAFYLISLPALEFYGRHFKALFDLYRHDLARSFNLEITLIPDREERIFWSEIGEYFRDER